MTTQEFWRIIEASRGRFDRARPDGNMQRQTEDLERELSKLNPIQVVEFSDHFRDRLIEAYRWDLWAVAYIIGNGCSDDNFSYFRNWLISMGRKAFESALSDPDSIADIAQAPGLEDTFFEEFEYVPDAVYEELTGEEIPLSSTAYPRDPSGKKWQDDHELKCRFPRVWEAFGVRSTD